MSGAVGLLGRLGRRIGKPPGYERIVRVLMPPENVDLATEVELRLEGAVYLARPAVPLDWNLFFFGTYEPELRRVMRKVLRPGCVAADIGANIGWHTVLMASLCGPAGRVLAFEPNPSVMERLRQTIDINRLDQVETIPVALSHTPGRLLFRAPPAQTASSGDGHLVASASANAGQEVIAVEVQPLDAIAQMTRLQRLDLVKIDVEGFEWPVLRGAERTIARHRPHVLFEHNEEYVGRGNGSAAEIHDYFTRYGYRLFALGRWRKRPIVRDQWPRCCNVWAVPGPRDSGAAC